MQPTTRYRYQQGDRYGTMRRKHILKTGTGDHYIKGVKKNYTPRNEEIVITPPLLRLRLPRHLPPSPALHQRRK